MWAKWIVLAASAFLVVVVAGCGGGGSTPRFSSGRDIANAIHCADYSEEQPGQVQNSGGKISGQAQAMAATFVRTVGYCQLFNQEIQTNEDVNIVMLKRPGDASKLDERLHTLCPLFSGDSDSGGSESLRADDWEVFLGQDRPGLGTLQKIKATIGGSIVNFAC